MRSRPHRFWLWLLPLALVGAQWLALVHGVVHARLGAGGPAAPAAARQAAAQALPSWVDALVGSHAGDKDCRLYDQGAGGHQAPPLVAAALPVLAVPGVVARWVARVWAAPARPPFCARAPPAPG